MQPLRDSRSRALGRAHFWLSKSSAKANRQAVTTPDIISSPRAPRVNEYDGKVSAQVTSARVENTPEQRYQQRAACVARKSRMLSGLNQNRCNTIAFTIDRGVKRLVCLPSPACVAQAEAQVPRLGPSGTRQHRTGARKLAQSSCQVRITSYWSML
jgi:hypothetical protein